MYRSDTITRFLEGSASLTQCVCQPFLLRPPPSVISSLNVACRGGHVPDDELAWCLGLTGFGPLLHEAFYSEGDTVAFIDPVVGSSALRKPDLLTDFVKQILPDLVQALHGQYSAFLAGRGLSLGACVMQYSTAPPDFAIPFARLLELPSQATSCSEFVDGWYL